MIMIYEQILKAITNKIAEKMPEGFSIDIQEVLTGDESLNKAKLTKFFYNVLTYPEYGTIELEPNERNKEIIKPFAESLKSDSLIGFEYDDKSNYTLNSAYMMYNILNTSRNHTSSISIDFTVSYSEFLIGQLLNNAYNKRVGEAYILILKQLLTGINI